jgi:hypothetical protein
VPVVTRRRIASMTIGVVVCALTMLAGCGDPPQHRYMLYNDTSGQRQVSLCTDDDCTSPSSVGWVDAGAYADVTLPGDRVVLKVASVDAGYVCAQGDDDLTGVLVTLSAVAPSAAEATRHCVT